MKIEFYNYGGSGTGGVTNPKVYQSVLQQSVTNAPTEVVLRNDFGTDMSFIWSYVSVGTFKATGIYDFLLLPDLSKVILFTSQSITPLLLSSPYFSVSGSSPNFVAKDVILIQEEGGGGKTNTLTYMRFEIRVYN
tara:strand:- start:3799 stop:4203 length:405 start_codon:yes stop_codon:yes gene_type:complete